MQLYVGNTVRLIGKVANTHSDKLTVQTSDAQKVTVKVKSPANAFKIGSVVEFIGKVEEDLTLDEFNSTPLTDNFAFDVYEDYVSLTHSFPHLFATKNK